MIVDDQHPFDCDPVCSARRCTQHAVWALFWSNPSLHTEDRRKVWLACPEHRDQLSAFLTVRGFLRESKLYVDAQQPRAVVAG